MARHTNIAFSFSLLLFALCLLPTSFAANFYNSSSTTPTSAVQLTTYLTTTPGGTSPMTVTSVVRPSPSGPSGAANSPAIQSSSNKVAIQHPFFLVSFCAWAAWVLTSFRNGVW